MLKQSDANQAGRHDDGTATVPGSGIGERMGNFLTMNQHAKIPGEPVGLDTIGFGDMFTVGSPSVPIGGALSGFRGKRPPIYNSRHVKGPGSLRSNGVITHECELNPATIRDNNRVQNDREKMLEAAREMLPSGEYLFVALPEILPSHLYNPPSDLCAVGTLNFILRTHADDFDTVANVLNAWSRLGVSLSVGAFQDAQRMSIMTSTAVYGVAPCINYWAACPTLAQFGAHCWWLLVYCAAPAGASELDDYATGGYFRLEPYTTFDDRDPPPSAYMRNGKIGVPIRAGRAPNRIVGRHSPERYALDIDTLLHMDSATTKDKDRARKRLPVIQLLVD